MPIKRVRKLFSDKIKQYDEFNRRKIVDQFDTNSFLVKREDGELDPYRIKVKDNLINNKLPEGLLDKNL